MRIGLEDILIPLALMSGGLILGIVVELIIMRFLKKKARETDWEVDVIVVESFQWAGLMYLYLLGVFLATLYMDLDGWFAHILQRVLISIVVVFTAHVFSKMLVRLTQRETLAQKGVPNKTTLVSLLPRILVYFVALMIILNLFNVSIIPFLAAFGIIGLALALALQDTLSNLFAGFQIIAGKKIRPGQYVQLDSGEEGHILDITWRNTRLKTLAGNLVVIPNMTMAGRVVTNFSVPQLDMGLSVPVEVSYNDDLDKAEKIMLEVGRDVMKNVKGGVPKHVVMVRYSEFGDASVKGGVNLMIDKYSSRFLVKHEFIKRLSRRFKEEGLSMSTPERRLFLNDEKKE